MDLEDIRAEVEEQDTQEEVLETGDEEVGDSPAPENEEEDEELGLFEHSSDYPDEFNARIRKANKLFNEHPKIVAEREQLRGDLEAFRNAIESGQLRWAGSEPEGSTEPEIPEGSVGDDVLDRALELMRNPDTAEKGTVEVLKALADLRRENRELRDGLQTGRAQSVEQMVRAGVPRLLEQEGFELSDAQRTAAAKMYKAEILDRGFELGKEPHLVTKQVLDEVKATLSLKAGKRAVKPPSPSPDTTSGRGAGLKPQQKGKRNQLGFDEIRRQLRAGAMG